MFSSTRSILGWIFLSGVLAGTPTLTGSGSWTTFFRDLFNLIDYQEIIDDQKEKSIELEKSGATVNARLLARNRVLEALVAKEINVREAAACFFHIRNQGDHFVAIGMDNQHETTIACLVLIKWLQSGGEIDLIDCHAYGEFEAEVQDAVIREAPVKLPLPPAKIIADLDFQ